MSLKNAEQRVYADKDLLGPDKAFQKFESSPFNLQGLSFRELEEISRGYVLGDLSLIVDCQEQLFEPALDEAMYWIPEPFPFEVLQNPQLKERLLDERKRNLNYLRHKYFKYFRHTIKEHGTGPVIYLCHPHGWYPYGHLHDSLQRLYSARNILDEPGIRFAVSDYAQVIDFVDHISALCGRTITPEDLITVKSREIHRFERLIIPYSPSVPTNFIADSYCWMLNRYLNYFFGDNPPEDRIPGIYLTRNLVSPGSRSVANEEEVINHLKSQGFVVVDGSESLQEIVRLFYTAKIVVAPHGALMANIIFCQPETRIVEFCAQNRDGRGFFNKVKLASDFRRFLVPADDRYNFSIPMDILKDSIEL